MNLVRNEFISNLRILGKDAVGKNVLQEDIKKALKNRRVRGGAGKSNEKRDVSNGKIGSNKPKKEKVLKSDEKSDMWGKKEVLKVVVAVGIALVCRQLILTDWSPLSKMVTETPCLAGHLAMVTMEMTRPRFDCEICRNLKQVAVVSKMDSETFAKKYAHTAIPLLVKGAASEWRAMKEFSYDLFKRMYVNNTQALEAVEKGCQYFHYNTKIASFKEVFTMSDKRAKNEAGQEHWYIGWCDIETENSRKLEEYYERLPFVPMETSPTPKWVFVGWPGKGANIHIDYVVRPSWNAVVSGLKSWRLEPPIECDGICHKLNVTMEPGDVLFVDGNKWFHETYIHEGEMSISIGSEY